MVPINAHTIIHHLDRYGTQTLRAIAQAFGVTQAQLLRPYTETIHGSSATFSHDWPGMFNIDGLIVSIVESERHVVEYQISRTPDSDTDPVCSSKETATAYTKQTDQFAMDANSLRIDRLEKQVQQLTETVKDLDISDWCSDDSLGVHSDTMYGKRESSKWWVWPCIWLVTIYTLTNPVVAEKLIPIFEYHHHATNHAIEAIVNYLYTVLDSTSEEYWWRQVHSCLPLRVDL